jgi:hypothetical protein
MKKVFKVFAGLCATVLAVMSALELLACWLWHN